MGYVTSCHGVKIRASPAAKRGVLTTAKAIITAKSSDVKIAGLCNFLKGTTSSAFSEMTASSAFLIVVSVMEAEVDAECLRECNCTPVTNKLSRFL